MYVLARRKQLLRPVMFAARTSPDGWHVCQEPALLLLLFYERSYSSIDCGHSAAVSLDPTHPRSNRSDGHKIECGIHIQPAPSL
jgi:phosphoadenosine phosphosulfate reductase